MHSHAGAWEREKIMPVFPNGLILFAFRPLSGKQNKDKLCALCALSKAGGELLQRI